MKINFKKGLNKMKKVTPETINACMNMLNQSYNIKTGPENQLIWAVALGDLEDEAVRLGVLHLLKTHKYKDVNQAHLREAALIFCETSEATAWDEVLEHLQVVKNPGKTIVWADKLAGEIVRKIGGLLMLSEMPASKLVFAKNDFEKSYFKAQAKKDAPKTLKAFERAGQELARLTLDSEKRPHISAVNYGLSGGAYLNPVGLSLSEGAGK